MRQELRRNGSFFGIVTGFTMCLDENRAFFD